MDSEQKNAGAGSVANGQPFPNTPKHSFSLWTSYKPMAKLTLGLGIYAQSSVNQSYILSTVDRKSTRLLQSPCNLVCRLLLEKKKTNTVRQLDAGSLVLTKSMTLSTTRR